MMLPEDPLGHWRTSAGDAERAGARQQASHHVPMMMMAHMVAMMHAHVPHPSSHSVSAHR